MASASFGDKLVYPEIIKFSIFFFNCNYLPLPPKNMIGMRTVLFLTDKNGRYCHRKWYKTAIFPKELTLFSAPFERELILRKDYPWNSSGNECENKTTVKLRTAEHSCVIPIIVNLSRFAWWNLSVSWTRQHLCSMKIPLNVTPLTQWSVVEASYSIETFDLISIGICFTQLKVWSLQLIPCKW